MAALVWMAALVISGHSGAQQSSTTRISVSSTGTQASTNSAEPAISADGRYVVFGNAGPGLVPGDYNNDTQIYVRDCQLGLTTCVSVDGHGRIATGECSTPSISADGRYVVFSSAANNLVPGDTNGVVDIFVHDQQANVTTRVSVDSTGAQQNPPGCYLSNLPAISADGRFVAFSSLAGNLVPGDTNGVSDVFVHDSLTGSTTLMSMSSGGAQGDLDSVHPAISADGRYVAFESKATTLVPGDTNGAIDIFVHDRVTGITTRASVGSSGSEGDGDSTLPSISADGRYVAFMSYATNLVPGDTNGTADIFLHDCQTGTTTRVSVSSAGLQANWWSEFPQVSPDGRFVLFSSRASNLVPGDTNGAEDVFVHDMLAGTTSRVSVDSSGVQGNLDSGGGASGGICPGGRYVTFHSYAYNLVPGDTNGVADVFLRDQGPAPIVASCFGDGSDQACPCANYGAGGHGCDNSSGTGGALLSANGTPSFAADTLVLTSSGEKPTALSIVLQGSDLIKAVIYGDGLRCVSGTLKRLYVKTAVAGTIVAPQGADPTISARSATLGDPIPVGATRSYQVYYRDPDPSFCPSPQGGTYNITNSLSAVWAP
jgi:Tol biopolymer transport system component